MRELGQELPGPEDGIENAVVRERVEAAKDDIAQYRDARAREDADDEWRRPFVPLRVVDGPMGDETDSDAGDQGEEQDVNQYGGGDEDMDALERTERREDDVETEDDPDDESE